VPSPRPSSLKVILGPLGPDFLTTKMRVQLRLISCEIRARRSSTGGSFCSGFLGFLLIIIPELFDSPDQAGYYHMLGLIIWGVVCDPTYGLLQRKEVNTTAEKAEKSVNLKYCLVSTVMFIFKPANQFVERYYGVVSCAFNIEDLISNNCKFNK
jgi:hypothetical protein